MGWRSSNSYLSRSLVILSVLHVHSLLELSDFDPDLVDSVLVSPIATLPHLTQGLQAAMTELLSTYQGTQNYVRIEFLLGDVIACLQ